MKTTQVCKASSLLWLLLASTASAQWTSQTISLRSGWNAVYLEVQPEPRDCDLLFAGLPIESAWRFNRKQTSIQFIDDPSRLVPNAPDWLTWLAVGHPLRSRSQLYQLEGGRPYLLKLADNAPAFHWTIRGKPVIRTPDWLADSLNFVGFPLPTNNPPTLQAFFTNSTELATGRSYRLNPNGIWVVVNNSGTNRMQRGEAIWIRSTGLPNYPGPLELQLDRRDGLDFGRILTEQTFRIRNTSTNASRLVSIRPLASESPAPGAPALAGAVPLAYWRDDFVNSGEWTPLPALLQSNVPPGGAWELRVEVRRREMTPYTPPFGSTEALYQSLLEVSAESTRLLVPVMARGLQDSGNNGPGAGGSGTLASGGGTAPSHPRAGLWVGAVSIDRVSQPSSSSPLQPVPTASELSFRILVHVDASGQATLLQKVLQMWKPGQTNSVGAIAVPGRFVLFTDERLITQQYTGAALRDGKPVGRRFSSAVFGFQEPIPMTGSGSFGDSGAAFTCDVLMSYTNSLNPFLHRYHPDHNNFTDRTDATGNPQPLATRTSAEGLLFTSEVPSVLRSVRLEFNTNVLNNLSGWGDTRLGANYTETIKGLHATPLRVQGDVFLQRASWADRLNQ